MKLVVFDIDGTLIQYHRKRNDRAYIKALAEVFGISVGDSWSGYISSTDSGILREIFQKHLNREASTSDISQFKQSMTKWLEQEYGEEPFEPTAGALQAWKDLPDHPEWRMAVGTGNWEFAGRFKLQSAGFELKDTPIGSADNGEIREKVLETSHHRALQINSLDRFEKTVYVGDWVWDVKAARTLGWDFVGIGSGETALALQKAGAQVILPDFNRLLPTLAAF